MKLSLDSRIREVYAHPVGRDIIDKVLQQLAKPAWLVTNRLVGGLRLGTIKKLTRSRLGTGFFDSLLELFNSEPDVPLQNSTAPVPAWWKEAVFYQIYPRSFTKDGLKGIISKLDYLCDLGIDAVWLSPVYDSPNDDNGYDIRDYYKILPEFGSMADMDALIDGLHRRGMKLVMDMVVNHTSDEHPWFQEALRDAASPYRDYYFFRKSDREPPNNWTSFFGGGAWNYYEEQDVWALHLFSKKQMDLHWENPAMREEIHTMARWWLEKGVDGFRLDVINYISKSPGLPDGERFIGALTGYTGVERFVYGPRLHTYLREMRGKVFDPYGAFSVGETPGVGTQMGRLLTDNYRRELDLIFSFDHLETPGHSRFDNYRYDLAYLKQFYMAHLNEDRGHGWNTLFYNNHDNPRMVSKIDPEGKFTMPLAKLLALLQLTLRGTPFIYQGDEYGAANAAFRSINELQDLESLNFYAQLIQTMKPDAAFKHILSGSRDHARVPLAWDEIERQRGGNTSVFNFYKDLIALRKKSPALVYGELEFLYPKNKSLLAYTRSLEGAALYIAANLRPKVIKTPAMQGARLLMSNYDTVESAILRPYEARIYSLAKA
ncbi:MAG: alpha-glucosidase [Spirochaetota bacterium]|jgi:oligo-1,6-glucosidase|nr:alpha-glucosidase [Spirochaetota bacterium]